MASGTRPTPQNSPIYHTAAQGSGFCALCLQLDEVRDPQALVLLRHHPACHSQGSINTDAPKEGTSSSLHHVREAPRASNPPTSHACHTSS